MRTKRNQKRTKIEDLSWPARAYLAVFCLHDHDQTLSDGFILSEVERLGLLEMTDSEFAQFRRRELLNTSGSEGLYLRGWRARLMSQCG